MFNTREEDSLAIACEEKLKTRSYQHRQVHATAALVRIVGSTVRENTFQGFSFILLRLQSICERVMTMKYRALGRTGWKVSEISFGAWAIGGFWGHVSDEDAMKTLHKAIDSGVNFIDTADVYGDGRSERLIAQLKKDRKDEIVVATKAGRRLPKQTVEGYNRQNLTAWINDSLRNLEADALDLLQLHCPPTDAYYHPEIFGMLDDLVKEGKIRYYGVSVERVEEALKAIEFPNVQSVQIIFNCFRQRPAEVFFQQAKQKKVGILARVPLASGMLSGKLRPDSAFPADDHRNFNRHGEMFDVGETFSGVDYQLGLDAVEKIRQLLPPGVSMSQFALRWILMFDAVSCAIPGGKRPEQVADNCHASDLAPLSAETMAAIQGVYDEKIRPQVHQRW
jgi:aryl-alcohol dehydrogenase-like predicted oxidoreductase